MDSTRVDALFDAAMKVTGQPPFTSMFDRRVLFPLDMLPDLVRREADTELEPGRVAEIQAAGWFRVERFDEVEGIPLFVASRVGLLLELEKAGYRHPELREFAEYEDYMVDEIYCSEELAYEDDDLRLLIDENERQLENLENSIRVIDEPGWTPEWGGWQVGAPREDLVERRDIHRRNLTALRRFESAGGVPEYALEELQRLAYRVRMGGEFTRLNMVESDRAKVRAGFSVFVTFENWPQFTALGDSFDAPYPIDWRRTVRSPWVAEDLGRRIFLQGMIVDGEDVHLRGAVPPARYDDLWRTYDLDAFYRERAELLNERICVHCLSPLEEDADPRKRYCSEPCRNAAKQKRFRDNNPRRDLEHKRRYYSSLPEMED